MPDGLLTHFQQPITVKHDCKSMNVDRGEERSVSRRSGSDLGHPVVGRDEVSNRGPSMLRRRLAASARPPQADDVAEG